MNTYILSLLIIGLLLLGVTLGSGWIERLPLSYALLYLIVGINFLSLDLVLTFSSFGNSSEFETFF